MVELKVKLRINFENHVIILGTPNILAHENRFNSILDPITELNRVIKKQSNLDPSKKTKQFKPGIVN